MVKRAPIRRFPPKGHKAWCGCKKCHNQRILINWKGAKNGLGKYRGKGKNQLMTSKSGKIVLKSRSQAAAKNQGLQCRLQAMAATRSTLHFAGLQPQKGTFETVLVDTLHSFLYKVPKKRARRTE